MTNPGSPAAAAEKQERLTELLAKLGTIRDYARLLEDRHRLYIERVHPRFRESARNLLHYLALRHQLTKTGLPSRAEVTDAAMAVRAECVMLNKGPHIRRSMRAWMTSSDAWRHTR